MTEPAQQPDPNFGAEWLVKLFKTSHQGTDVVMQFTCGDESRANYLAGVCLDTLADNAKKGTTFDYSVRPVSHVRPMDSDAKLIRWAVSLPL